MRNNLRFTFVKCQNCGKRKPISDTCVFCGSQIKENDPLVEKRIKIVGIARNALDEEKEKDLEQIDIIGEWQKICSCLLDIDKDFKRIGRNKKETKQRLIDHFKNLVELEQRIKITHWYRPKVEIYRTAHEILKNIKSYSFLICDALCAQTPEEAKVFVEEGSETIEKANKLLDNLMGRLKRWEQIPSAPFSEESQGIEALAKTSYQHSGAKDFLEYVQKGKKLSKQVLEDEALHTLGAGLQMTEMQVELVMDSQRFWKTVKKLYDTFISKPEYFRRVIYDSKWLDDFQRLTIEMHEIGLEASNIATIEGYRMNAKACISLGGKIVERAVPTLLAVVLSVIQKKGYKTVRKKDANYYIKQVENTNLKEILFGFDIELRDAEAHAACLIKENGVTFTSTRSKNYTWLSTEALQDRVLGAVESTLAIHAAIASAAVKIGFNVEKIDPLVLLKPEISIRLVLIMHGWLEVNVKSESEKIIIYGKAPGTTNKQNLYICVAMVIPYLPKKYKHITLKATVPQILFCKKLIVEGPIEPLEKWQRYPNGLHKDCAFMEAWMRWNVGGSLKKKKRLLRKWIAIQCEKILNEKKNIKDLVLLQELAERLEDMELSQAVDCVKQGLANKHLRLPRDESRIDGINKLIKWSKIKIRQNSFK